MSAVGEYWLATISLYASTRPSRRPRASSEARSARSLTTAAGTAKAPVKFFFPKVLMPFFTPTPASPWPSRVIWAS